MTTVQETQKKLKEFFEPKALMDLAKETKFIQRTRKITPITFVKNVIVASAKEKHASLEFIAGLFHNEQIKISKQSVHEKINGKAVEFLKKLFERLCACAMDETRAEDYQQKFTEIVVVDSSEIKVNKGLKKAFPGTQNGARCKIQTRYYVLENQIACEITKVNRSDKSYKEYLQDVKAGSLLLMDVGYYRLKSFREIEEKGGKYITRLQVGTKLYDKFGKELKIEKWLKRSGGKIDREVLVGKEEQLRCRLVGKRLAGSALKKRRDKRKRDKRRSSRKERKRKEREQDKWGLYLTNVEEMGFKEVYNLYRIRWQIELLFKVMKTKWGMGEINEKSEAKTLLVLYGKLIGTVLGMLVVGRVERVEISLYKAMDYYKEKLVELIEGTLKGKEKLLKVLQEKVKRFGQKSSRKSRPSTLQLCGLGPAF